MAENKQRIPGFVGPAYTARSARFDDQKLVNFYIEMDELGLGKGGEPAVLISTPGLKFLQTIGTGPIRATYVQSNAETIYVVSGNQVFVLDGPLAVPYLCPGNLTTSTGAVAVADNGIEVLFVDGTASGVYLTIGATPSLTIINDVHFHATDTVTYQDGYFICVDKGTGSFFLSDLYAVTWPPLNEATTTIANDNLVAAISCNDLLYLLGTKSTEIWYNEGSSASTPFVRQTGRYSQVGCVAPSSVVILNETFFWLGTNGQGGGIVYNVNNSFPTRVSNFAVEYAIQQAGDLSLATAYAYQQEGHFFYVLNIPGTNTSWVYDTTCAQWHERQSTVNGVTSRHFGETHAYVDGQHIIGDYRNGNIYRYDLNTYTDNGEVVQRIRQAPHSTQNLNNVFYSLLEIDMQFGVGLSGNEGTLGFNPRIALQISNDGGSTWGNAIYASMGKTGQYRHRARWQRLGYARDRVYRVIVTEPVRCTILSAMQQIEVGQA